MARKICFLITILIVIISVSAETKKLDINDNLLQPLTRTISIINIENKSKNPKTSDHINFLSGLIELNISGAPNLTYAKTDSLPVTAFSVHKLSKEIEKHILIYGTVYNTGNTFYFTLTAWDNILNKNSIQKKITISTNYYEELTDFASNFVREIQEYASTYSEVLFQTVIELSQSTDIIKKNLADYLLQQNNAIVYDYYTTNNMHHAFPVLFGKINIRFTNPENIDFIIEIDGIQFNSSENMLTLCFDRQPSNVKPADFIFYTIDDTEMKNQKKISLIMNKGVITNSIPNYKFNTITQAHGYVDFSNTITTLGYTGFDIQCGMVFPKMTEIQHSVYIKFAGEANLLNAISDLSLPPDFIFRTALGYRFHQYIFRTIGINFGLEAGGEISITKRLTENSKILHTAVSSAGFPAFYVGFPINIEFPSSSMVSFIAGFTPTLRLVQQSYLYENVIWIGNLEREQGFSDIFKYKIHNELQNDQTPQYGLNLFVYNMPINIGFRVKF